MTALEIMGVCNSYQLLILADVITVGHFQWGGSDFSERAKHIRFDPEEGCSHVPVLRAKLQDDRGWYLEGDVNLAERINNRDGYLQFSW
jgi:hypothetical protein